MGLEGKAGVRNLIVGLYQATPTTLSDGELGPVQVDSSGRLLLGADVDIGDVDILSYHSGQTISYAVIDDDTITGGTYGKEIVAAVAAKKIYVVELLIMVNAQCELDWVEDPQGTPAILTATAPTMFFAQRGYLHLPDGPGYRFATNTVNKALGLDEVDNATVKVRGYLRYYTAA